MNRRLALFANWRADLPAGFVLSLIALPLSIGIALASGAPASAGLIAAMVGGIVGSLLGGSQLTINGPAAGLIVIVLGASQSLGMGDPAIGFRMMLAATVCAGVLQILLGVFKLANIGLAFPSSVIHGMLTAIGAIIIAKQSHVLLGVIPESKSVLGLYTELPGSILHLNPEITYIGIVCLLILVLLPKLPIGWIKKVPAPLVAAVAGILMGRYFQLEQTHGVHLFRWHAVVGQNFLLNIPRNISQSLVTPDFARLLSGTFVVAVVSIALVASIESTLSAFAVDKLDPQKRATDLNRDLWSKGICNLICGLIGGLPIIAEIVRSSANIDNGAKSRLSNFFHGCFIALFLILIPGVLHGIPLAALAAILLFVGWRLAHPSNFKHAFHIGLDHIVAFLVTFTVTVCVDLLVGVLLGLLTEAALALIHGARLKHFFRLDLSIANGVIRCRSPAIFSNSLLLRRAIEASQQAGESVTVDFSASRFVDHTVVDQLGRLATDFAARGLKLTVRYAEGHRPLSAHPLAARKQRTAA